MMGMDSAPDGTLHDRRALLVRAYRQGERAFGTVGEVIAAHGGEVLKFMGDAVSRSSRPPDDQDRRAACRKAMAAAEEFTQRTNAANARRRSAGASPVSHALVLDVGEVAYGNVGAAHRMDFTPLALRSTAPAACCIWRPLGPTRARLGCRRQWTRDAIDRSWVSRTSRRRAPLTGLRA